MNRPAPELTTRDIVAYYTYEGPGEWDGHGYLSAVSARAADTDAIAAANKALIIRANTLGWDIDQLRYFLNSKAGRWFGDDASGMSGWLGGPEGHTAACCAEAIRVTADYEWAPGKCVARGQHRP